MSIFCLTSSLYIPFVYFLLNIVRNRTVFQLILFNYIFDNAFKKSFFIYPVKNNKKKIKTLTIVVHDVVLKPEAPLEPAQQQQGCAC